MSIIGAGIGAVGGLISGLVGNRARRRAATTAHRRNVEQWKRQNEYNDPSQQMARLKSAGLNPNMVYGTGTAAATGQASSAPAAPMARQENIPLGGKGIADYISLEQLGIQKQLANSTEKLQNSQSAKTQQETQKLDMANFLQGLSQNWHSEKLNTEWGKIRGSEAFEQWKNGELNDLPPAIKNVFLETSRNAANTEISRLGVDVAKYKSKLAQFGADTSDQLYVRLAAMYTLEQGYDLNSARGLTIGAQAIVSLTSMFMKGGLAKAALSGRHAKAKGNVTKPRTSITNTRTYDSRGKLRSRQKRSTTHR